MDHVNHLHDRFLFTVSSVNLPSTVSCIVSTPLANLNYKMNSFQPEESISSNPAPMKLENNLRQRDYH